MRRRERDRRGWNADDDRFRWSIDCNRDPDAQRRAAAHVALVMAGVVRGWRVAAPSLHHLQVVIGDRRQRLATADRWCNQDREGDQHSEERKG